MVTLAPIVMAGYQGTVDAVVRLSSQTKVILQGIAGPGNSGLMVLNPDGTNRTILTQWPVRKIRCLNGKIYTLEMMGIAAPASQTISETSMDRFAFALRMYDLTSGTVATLWRSERNRILDVLPGNQCLYLFSNVSDKEATGTCKVEVMTFPLATGARVTTAVISLATESPPSNFVLYNDCFYYIGRQKTKVPGVTSDTIYRVNLASMARHKVLEDETIAGFCFIPDINQLAYVTIRPVGWRKGARETVNYFLKIRPFEGPTAFSFVGPIKTDRWCSDLYYDTAEHSLIVRTTARTSPHTKEFQRMVLYVK
jgi:hypothetical protein